MKRILMLEISPPWQWKPRRQTFGPNMHFGTRYMWGCFAVTWMWGVDINDMHRVMKNAAKKELEEAL